MAECPGQIGWDFGPKVMGERKVRRPRQSTGQRKALAKVREDKKAVAGRRSCLADLDWTGAKCLRCNHACSGTHNPASTGRCKALGCNCLWALVACTCGHDSARHERWGDEKGTGCDLCSCPAMDPQRNSHP